MKCTISNAQGLLGEEGEKRSFTRQQGKRPPEVEDSISCLHAAIPGALAGTKRTGGKSAAYQAGRPSTKNTNQLSSMHRNNLSQRSSKRRANPLTPAKAPAISIAQGRDVESSLAMRKNDR